MMKKIVSALKNPALAYERTRNLLRGRFVSKKYNWQADRDGSLKKKNYSDYDEYVEHQKLKLDMFKEGLVKYDQEYCDELEKRLAGDGVLKAGMNVLCLAARLGTEVKSFINLNCFAVGIDLNPGEKNKYVVTGDFHDLQYPDGSVDVVFCNSLDHAFDLSKLIAEVVRVTKGKGLFILEIVKGAEEGGAAGYWEALSWGKADNVIKMIEEKGFVAVKKFEFEKPWEGWHVVLEKTI